MTRGPFERLRIPDSSKTALERLSHRMMKIEGKDRRDIAIRRLDACLELLDQYIRFLESIPAAGALHPFHLGLIGSVLGEYWEEEVEEVRARLLKGRKIGNEYRRRLLRCPTERVIQVEKEGIGRTLSFLRRSSMKLDRLIGGVRSLSRIDNVDPSLLTIIVAGLPNVGKSSLVSLLSSAKPEVAPYPFTTKEVHVGHMNTTLGMVQVLDTPGLLDRPEKERNQIERKAVNALKNLSGLVLFVLDGSDFTPEDEELNVLDEVLVLGKPTICCINRIDMRNEEKIISIRKELERRNLQWVELSCKTGEGIDVLKDAIESSLNQLFRNRKE